MKPSPASIVVAAMGLLCPAFAGQAPTPAATSPLNAGEIVAHLARTIAWYRHMAAVEQSPQVPSDLLVRDSTQRTSTRALQLAFDFARAAVPLVSAGEPAGGKALPASFRVEQASTRANERVTTLEGRIAEVDAALAKAGARTRATLTARRKELLAELDLAKQVKDSMQGLRTFLNSQATSSGGADLPAYIDRLERTVPEAMRATQLSPAQTPAQGTAAAAAGSPFRPESAGIVALLTETIRMARGKRQLDDAAAETATLQKNVDQIRAPLVSDLRTAIRRSDAAASDSGAQDAEQMDADRQEIEALTARFKQVSAALVPLREQGLLIQNARASLVEWRNTVEQRFSAARSHMFFRVMAMAAIILLVVAISALWRRATFRYVRDARRRKQFLMMRRVVVTCVVVAMVVLGLVNELGSLATYAGFLTAGLAVALQNVILSVVAYFFLIGRYGIRVGDRVTISGVTGDVIDIGLVRMYLMEMAGAGADLRATGRVVGFSNSVVFQPAALFKQMPGTDYVWHTVALTLAPDTDSQLAETRLMAAVGSVYEQYRERIEKQHAASQRLVDLPLSTPKPEGRLRLTNAGLEFSVRYPAEMQHVAETDRQVIKALCDTVAQEPGLQLTDSGAPKLQALV
jgi:small-conductance mechanosensitive channel